MLTVSRIKKLCARASQKADDRSMELRLSEIGELLNVVQTGKPINALTFSLKRNKKSGATELGHKPSTIGPKEARKILKTRYGITCKQ